MRLSKIGNLDLRQPNYWPTAKQSKRFFAAQTNRLTQGWDTQPQHIDQLLRAHLRALRARSREQGINNDYAKRYIYLAASNIVGHEGVMVQSQVKIPRTDRLDTAANDAIERAWSDFSINECEVSGCHSFVDIQTLAVRTLPTDGEFLLIESDGGKYGYQVQMVDAEQLDVDFSQRLPNGNLARLGVEFTPAGKPAAYWFNKLDQYGNYIRGKRDRVPAERVIHFFLPEWIGQARGVPWLSAALFRMKMIGGYEDAAVVAARAGADKHGFIKTSSGEGYTGQGVDNLGNTIMDSEPGSWDQIPSDAEIISHDPSYPHEQYDSFMKRALRGMSSGLPGANYNHVANDLEGVNFSSLRSGALEDRELWKMMQTSLINRVVRRVRQKFVSAALLRQKITINGIPLGMNSNGKGNGRTTEDYQAARYQGRRWQWVDPQKEANGQQMALNMAIKSRSQIIREDGRDPDDVFREIAEENQKMAELGIAPVQTEVVTINGDT